MLSEKSLKEFLEELASNKPAPGGGSTAALAGSLAAALVEMVSKLTDTEEMNEISTKAEKIRRKLTELIDEDCEAFKEFVKAPKNQKEEALKRAALVPLETAGLSYEILELVDKTAREGNKNTITDAGIALLLVNAALQGADLNVRINLYSIKDEEFKKKVEEKLERFSDFAKKSRAIIKHVEEQLQL